MRRRAVAAWTAGLVLGPAAGVGTAAWVGRTDATAPVTSTVVRPTGDRVQAAVDGVRADHFYAAPELRDRLTTSQISAIAKLAADAPTPTYVVYWGDMSYGRYGGYRTDYEALDQLMAGVGVRGHYAIVTDGGGTLTASRGLQDPFVDPDLAKGRPDAALTRYVTAFAAVPAEAGSSYSARSESKGGSDYWGGPGGGLAAGVLFAGGGFLVLMLLVWLASLARRGTT